MPLASLPAALMVLTMGPVFAYNLACVAAVALAGWCAFGLCRYLSGEYWTALAGGYVFGFSAYMLGQTAAHLDLILTFPIPLFALLLIRGFRADLAWRPLVAGLVLVLAAQFLLFVELFATTALFAAIAFFAVLIVGASTDKALDRPVKPRDSDRDDGAWPRGVRPRDLGPLSRLHLRGGRLHRYPAHADLGGVRMAKLD
jgi:hypothetical protein